MKHTKWLFENADQYDIDPMVKQGLDQFTEAYEIISKINAVKNNPVYKKASSISDVNSTGQGSADIDNNFSN